jgi:hypothetical protein
VKIEIVDPAKRAFVWDHETSGLKDFEERITTWMARYGKRPTWTIGGGIDFSEERCDYHNSAERTGMKVSAAGNIDISLPDVETDFIGISIYPGVTLKPRGKIDKFTLSGELKFTYNEENGDPWVDPVTGNLTGTSGATVGADLQLGPGALAFKLSAEGSIAITGTVNFDNQGKNIRLASANANIGSLKLNFAVKALTPVGNFTILSGSPELWGGIDIPAPGLPKTFYTIPD